MNSAALDRILQRIALALGGTASAAGGTTWEITVPEDAEQEDGPTFSFRHTFTLEGGRVADIRCEAPLDRLPAPKALLVGEVSRELAAAIAREGVVFGGFREVEEFLVAELGAEVEEGYVEIAGDDEDAPSVIVSDVRVAGEPWVNLSVPFVDEVDPLWLLEQSGTLTHLHFETYEGEVSLACAFPLALLTGERLMELVDDLTSFRGSLLDELEEGDEDEDEG
jgi:hypothetical protein